MKAERICIVGLGYIGLPLAVALSKHYQVDGYDIDGRRVMELREGKDRTNSVGPKELKETALNFTTELPGDCTIYIVTVPTPITKDKRPDLAALRMATDEIDLVAPEDAIICYESTVYPGCTEGLWLEKDTQRIRLAYSPERINPGDKVNTLETTVKIVSAEDDDTLDRMCAVYESIVKAGVHRAPNIKTAEAAKVLENTQRDINIALMNECSVIFDALDIDTNEVLAAARTKWNFGDYRPGLVGGACIPDDPYYLAAAAVRKGIHPEMILAGRRINDGVPKRIANKVREFLLDDWPRHDYKAAIFGRTYKANVPDRRNSLVDSLSDLLNGLHHWVFDPLVGEMPAWPNDYSVVIYAVAHDYWANMSIETFLQFVDPNGLIIDITGTLDAGAVLESGRSYWQL